MKIGIVGLPNKGKSSFFSCLTSIEVPIANYPFTTIDPNSGLGYIMVDCACRGLGVTCNPRTKCIKGKRFVPVNLVDIAGIVKDAHMGKGLGNYFLDRVRDCDAIIQVIDISGGTDLAGNPVPDYSANPAEELAVFEQEFVEWVVEILKKNGRKFRGKGYEELAEILSGMNFTSSLTEKMLTDLGLDPRRVPEDEQALYSMSRWVWSHRPMAVICNKFDAGKARENIQKLSIENPYYPFVAVAELFARKLEKQGILELTDSIILAGDPGEFADRIKVLQKVFSEVKLSHNILTEFVLNQMGYIVVFPVEDEKKLCDKKGNVLPDAILLRKGSTPLNLAAAIHTDLAKKLITAIDVKKGMNIAKDHVLNHLDVIKLVAGK